MVTLQTLSSVHVVTISVHCLPSTFYIYSVSSLCAFSQSDIEIVPIGSKVEDQGWVLAVSLVRIKEQSVFIYQEQHKMTSSQLQWYNKKHIVKKKKFVVSKVFRQTKFFTGFETRYILSYKCFWKRKIFLNRWNLECFSKLSKRKAAPGNYD